MAVESERPLKTHDMSFRLPIILTSAFIGIVYYFSNPRPSAYYDYTFRVAGNLLRGAIGFTEKQPPWLNEFVPFESYYYSVFPLGSVLTMIPAAFLKATGLITDMPGAFLAALCAGVSAIFMLLIARRYEVSRTRATVMTLGFLLGTWTWTNLAMAGAWQLALGFALVGELGAIYFTVYERRPVLAGIFFALAFGNRTEVLLTAPIFFYFLIRDNGKGDSETESKTGLAFPGLRSAFASGWYKIALFCCVPFALGVATLIYNYVRFHSFTDFGYARIPGVLQEPWYSHGIFSIWYIPAQMWEMLIKPWEQRPAFPYIRPNGFSSSILWSSPFMLFAARFGARDRALKYLSWAAILVICIILWMHGNSGGWQFGYRYAIACLPWLFVIMLESSPQKISPIEWAAYIFAFAANAYATWLFHWTDYMTK